MISESLASRLRNARSVTAFTGAGMSAESGVPTFRGEEGIWKKFRPEELANFDAFMRNPDLVWEWYKHRKQIISTIKPHAGHFALAEIERHFSDFSVVTQNIDNLHRRAGSRNIHELHGNIERNYCIACGKAYSNDEVLSSEKAPHCKACGGLIRPDVVWFGEMLPEDEWHASLAAAKRSDVFLAVGTTAIVHPAASLPIVARRSGAYVVEINIDETEITGKVDESVRGKAGEVLPELAALLPHAVEK